MIYVTCGDLRLAVETLGAGAPLIWSHGLTASRAYSRRQLAPLAHEYQLVLYDQRGHGDSTPATDPAAYDPEAMAADIGAILDALGLAYAIVGGDSMGAATALLFALRHPERVAALILSIPAFADVLNPGRKEIRAIGHGYQRLGSDRFAASVERELLLEGLTPQASAFWAGILRSHQAASLAVACEVMASWVILPDLAALATLTMPTLIIAVENDAVHPLALARRMERALPDATLRLAPAVHAMFEEPELVGRLVRAFLEAPCATP